MTNNASDPAVGGGTDGDKIDLGGLGDTTGFLVRRLHNQLATSWSADFADAPIALTPVQAGLLTLIANNPGITQRRLVRAMDVEPASLVASIQRLARLGLITKTPGAHDGRLRELRPTVEGSRTIGHIGRAMARRHQRLAGSVPPGDYKTFMAVLKRLCGLG